MLQLRIILLEARPKFWRPSILPNCSLAALPQVVTRVCEGIGNGAVSVGEDRQRLITGCESTMLVWTSGRRHALAGCRILAPLCALPQPD